MEGKNKFGVGACSSLRRTCQFVGAGLLGLLDAASKGTRVEGVKKLLPLDFDVGESFSHDESVDGMPCEVQKCIALRSASAAANDAMGSVSWK